MPSGSERQKEKLCWNGRDSVPDEGGDDSDHEEKSEKGLSVKSLDNHQDLPSIVKEQMDELKTMTEQIKLAQRGKTSFFLSVTFLRSQHFRSFIQKGVTMSRRLRSHAFFYYL